MSSLSPHTLKFTRQLDIVEWARNNKIAIRKVAASCYAVEKGFGYYANSAVEFFTDMRKNRQERKSLSKEEKDKKETEERLKNKDNPLQQYYQSQDLIKKMKWKRVTWAKGVNFDAISRRVMDNDQMFSKVPAFSFLSLHFVKENSTSGVPPPLTATMVVGTPPTPTATNATNSTQNVQGGTPLAATATATATTGGTDVNSAANAATAAADEELKAAMKAVGPITEGTYSNIFLQWRQPASNPPKFIRSAVNRRPPIFVDWVSGEARISENASAEEILNFLRTTAPRLQAVQQRMEAQQTKITEDLEKARLRMGVYAIKFNANDRSFWDDDTRKANPTTYVDPDQVTMFLNSSVKEAYLLRRLFKGTEVRIAPAGSPYSIDEANRAILIPSNFEEYHHMSVHGRYEALESFFNAIRRTWWVWFTIGMMLVGDLEAF